MRVAILGSNSFAGRDFAELLLSTDHFDVLGISRSSQKSSAILARARYNNGRFTFRQFDMNHDIEGIVAALSSFEARCVVNFAAQGDDAASWAHPADFFETNCVALARLVDQLKDSSTISRFVQVSSSGVYGSSSAMVTEQSPLQPESPYSASKAAADLLLLAYAKGSGFPVSIVRPPNLFGPHQQLFRIIPKTVVSLKRGVLVELHGGAHSARPYLHVRDASRAILNIVQHGRVGEAYNIGPDDLTRVRDVVAMICDFCGRDFATTTIDVPDRRTQSAIKGYDSAKIRHELGWAPEISLLQGIQNVGDWIDREWEDLMEEELEYSHTR